MNDDLDLDGYESVSVEHLMFDLAAIGATYEVRGKVLIPTGERSAYTSHVESLVQARRVEIIAFLTGQSVEAVASIHATPPAEQSLAAAWGGTKMGLDWKMPWYWEKDSGGQDRFYGPVYDLGAVPKRPRREDGMPLYPCHTCGSVDYWLAQGRYFSEEGTWLCAFCFLQPVEGRKHFTKIDPRDRIAERKIKKNGVLNKRQRGA